MNTLYLRAAGLSLSLVTLLPISATVPNGNEVLSTINGVPVITAMDLQQKLADLTTRAHTAHHEVKQMLQSMNKADFAQCVLKFKEAAKCAELYVAKNNVAGSNFSKTIIDAAEVVAHKHFGIALREQEKNELHNCILLTMNLAEQLQKNPDIANALGQVPETVVDQAYKDIKEQVSRYNFKTTPTYQEVSQLIRLCIAVSTSPEVNQQVRLHALFLVVKTSKEYNLQENVAAIARFMQERGVGKVL